MSSSPDSSLDCLDPEVVDGGYVLRVRRFLEPRHLVGIAAVVSRCAETGRVPVRLEIPDEEQAHYAARMRLGEVLDAVGCAHALPQVTERPQRGRLLEVSALRGQDAAGELAGLVRERLRRRNREIAGALFESVFELGFNVYDHADPEVDHRPSVGFAAAQTMTQSNEVVFAVADHGVGMLGTLAVRGAEDDQHAITLALAGTSRLAGATRGLGVSSTARLVTELGGRLAIVSGAASVTVGARATTRARLRAPFQGTLLQARIPLR